MQKRLSRTLRGLAVAGVIGGLSFGGVALSAPTAQAGPDPGYYPCKWHYYTVTSDTWLYEYKSTSTINKIGIFKFLPKGTKLKARSGARANNGWIDVRQVYAFGKWNESGQSPTDKDWVWGKKVRYDNTKYGPCRL